MSKIHSDIVASYFKQYCGGVKFRKDIKAYFGSCVICREGKSWLKKKRCYYFPDKESIYCHNCGWSSHVNTWLRKVTGKSYHELLKEGSNYIPEFNVIEITSQKKVPSLPKDCINLFDPVQVKFYQNNAVVKQAIQFLKDRRIIEAVNKPKAMYVSLTDYIHKNRIIIPYFDNDGGVQFYQSRTLLKEDVNPRYMSKCNGIKSVFGINNVTNKTANVYIFEGPINAMFVENGLAVSGIQESSDILYTAFQTQEMQKVLFYNKIWVLDSQWIDSASYKKTERLLKLGETVFIWPEAIGKQCKDFNDLAILKKVNIIAEKFILSSIYKGTEGLDKLKQIPAPI